MNSVPSLDIVIVNWNAGEMLHRCVKSMLDYAEIPVQVIVVDNASSDGSMAVIQERYPAVKCVLNPGNAGFAAACNQGARMGKADYVLFLNPDAEVGPATLKTALEYMESPDSAKVGICGVSLLDELGQVAASCFHFPTVRRLLHKISGLNWISSAWFPECLMDRMDYSESQVVDQVIGAFFLVRRSLYDALSGFDEQFFVYFEEVDFSYRAFLAGWQSYYLASARAHHVGGGCSDKARAHRIFYSCRSRIVYAAKHFSRLESAIVVLSTFIIEPVARIAFAVVRGRFSDIREISHGFGMLYRDGAMR